MTRGLGVFLAGDFNRHDSLWGGDRVACEHQQGEAEGLLDFIENNNLQLLTPRGAATWERDGIAVSTINLAFATVTLFEDRILCQLFPNEYGSAHRAVHTVIALPGEQQEIQTRSYILQRANWSVIRQHVQQRLHYSPFPNEEDTETMQAYLQGAVQTAIEQHCPKARPSAYAKRW